MSDQQPPEQPPGQPWLPPQGYPQQNYPPQAQPGHPGQGYPPPGFAPYTPEPPATSKATTALVLGIVGLTVCPGVASIPAWIIGNDAVKEIDASNGALGGRSSAFAGKVTGIIGTVLGLLGILALGAIFLISAIFVDSVHDCFENLDQATTSDTC